MNNLPITPVNAVKTVLFLLDLNQEDIKTENKMKAESWIDQLYNSLQEYTYRHKAQAATTLPPGWSKIDVTEDNLDMLVAGANGLYGLLTRDAQEKVNDYLDIECQPIPLSIATSKSRTIPKHFNYTV